MTAATFFLALVAATAGFILSYFAAGFGVLASLAIGYLAGSLTAIAIVGTILAYFSAVKKQSPRFSRDGVNSRRRS